MGAPLGNQNAKKGKPLADAINKALIQGDPERLARIANKLLTMAEAGDMQAIKEIGDRLDGKPKQQTELTGPEGGPVETVTRFKLADLE